MLPIPCALHCPHWPQRPTRCDTFRYNARSVPRVARRRGQQWRAWRPASRATSVRWSLGRALPQRWLGRTGKRPSRDAVNESTGLPLTTQLVCKRVARRAALVRRRQRHSCGRRWKLHRRRDRLAAGRQHSGSRNAGHRRHCSHSHIRRGICIPRQRVVAHSRGCSDDRMASGGGAATRGESPCPAPSPQGSEPGHPFEGHLCPLDLCRGRQQVSPQRHAKQRARDFGGRTCVLYASALRR